MPVLTSPKQFIASVPSSILLSIAALSVQEYLETLAGMDDRELQDEAYRLDEIISDYQRDTGLNQLDNQPILERLGEHLAAVERILVQRLSDEELATMLEAAGDALNESEAEFHCECGLFGDGSPGQGRGVWKLRRHAAELHSEYRRRNPMSA